MPLDGVSASCLADELNTILQDARVDRVYQPDRHDILLVLRGSGRNQRLLLSANPSAPRLHLTDEDRENPGSPPMFCMLLRKYLLGARLTSVATPGFERIFTFTFQRINEVGDLEEKRLVVEIMGRHSNIMLLNADGRIHDAIHHVDESVSRVREIMPARLYALPPVQDKTDPLALLEQLQTGQAWLSPALAGRHLPGALLSSIQGFSPQLCQEVIYRAGLDERLRVAQLDGPRQKQLDLALRELLSQISEKNYVPTAFYAAPNDVIPLDFHALNLQHFACAKPCTSLSQAMDLFYTERSRQNTLKQKKQVLEKKAHSRLEHVQRLLQIHQTDIQDGLMADEHKKRGDLILANLTNWQEGTDHLMAVDYFDPAQPLTRIALEPGLNAVQMAQLCFRRYNRARARGTAGARLAAQDIRELEWLESLLHELEEAESLPDLAEIRREMSQGDLLAGQRSAQTLPPAQSEASDLNPGKAGSRNRRRQQDKMSARKAGKKKKESSPVAEKLPPRRYTSADGLTILVGRNNLQNDELTLRRAAKDDLWLHVQKMPGSHVIVRTERGSVPQKTLEEAAAIAAWFSRATHAGQVQVASGSHKVAVDYCPVSHVRKPSGARPGMVIYENYQTILVSPALPDKPLSAAQPPAAP